MVNDNDKKKSAELNKDILGYLSVHFVRMSSNELEICSVEHIPSSKNG